jgi:rhodanese-related sulfurtransferase/DNA-binding transcriptional ArsR family regulator
MTSDSINESHKHKVRLYVLFSQISSALANPHRLELIDLLTQSPRTVDELAVQAAMSIANTSQHLQRLKRAHLVVDERDGQFIRYRVADPAVTRLWLNLRSVGERQLAEVGRALDAYRDRRHDFEKITPADLQARLTRNEVILLDVRPIEEYLAGHFPGAISMPIKELAKRMGELPKEKQIVAYCRGPYCVYADQALEILAKHGWKVARLEEGVAELVQAGYVLE